MVTKEEYILWKDHIVTKMLYEAIQHQLQALSNFVMYGGTIGENFEQATSRYIGRSEALQDMLAWTPIEEEDATY
jgi:hypothetical protein